MLPRALLPAILSPRAGARSAAGRMGRACDPHGRGATMAPASILRLRRPAAPHGAPVARATRPGL
ncbi:hypothetical protein ROS9278_00247 [Roseomonas sp. CECT 9278]|nr:hypothetical protein ROS9278_00247 [Roseomonas sp. CECT 9278]